MSLDRATVEQWLEHAESEGAQLGPFAAVCESWLRQEEALQAAEQALVDLHESLFIGSERGLSKQALGEMARFAKDAALASRPQAEEEKPDDDPEDFERRGHGLYR